MSDDYLQVGHYALGGASIWNAPDGAKLLLRDPGTIGRELLSGLPDEDDLDLLEPALLQEDPCELWHGMAGEGL